MAGTAAKGFLTPFTLEDLWEVMVLLDNFTMMARERSWVKFTK